jgi:isoleucyl-tRNA synthetase
VENRTDVQKRVGEFLYETDTQYQNKTILIVGHASSTFALRSVAEGADINRSVEIRKEGYMNNAEVREVPFTPLPHNDSYVLDYHRPYIDNIDLYDEDGTKLERVLDVFDCWFESGSMPYGQNHYPFENLDVFNAQKGKGFPAQFIAEGLDQTRGWFYSLIVLGIALFGRSPYENVIVNGLVLAEDGKKMSKKLQNYPDPVDLANRVGADAMRFYLLSAPIVRGEDLNFSEKGVLELQRKNIGRLHNVLAMYEMYADGTRAANSSSHVLDRWILSRLSELIAESTEGFKNYELDRATRPITDFIDDVSVWYVRRSRDRFKSHDQRDKKDTLATLRYVLQTLSLVMAPSMPFYADYLWGRVKEEDEEESVHLASWPHPGMIDTDLLCAMKEVREVVSHALEERTRSGIKVRQPLSMLYVKNDSIVRHEPYRDLVLDEVNVKAIDHDPHIEGAVAFNTEITQELKEEGDVREFVRQIQDMRKNAHLQPSDRIALCIQTSKDGEALIDAYRTEIEKIVGADHIAFSPNNGEGVTAGEHSFTITLEKR